MNKLYVFFLAVLVCPVGCLLLTNCTTDIFSYSVSEHSSLSEKPKPKGKNSALLTYCNRIHEDGFRGLLTAYYDNELGQYTHNTTWLFLWEVPFELKIPSNYVQLHRFYIRSNKEIYNKAPVEAEAIRLSNSKKVSIVTAINKDLLSDMGGLTIPQLINKHGFLLQDMGGWQGLSLSLFDSQNKPIKTVKALIPPFESNPNTFLAKHDQEVLLTKLHPFSAISLVKSTTEKTFHEKSKDNCENSPIPMRLPEWSSQAEAETEAEEEQPDENEIPSVLPAFE